MSKKYLSGSIIQSIFIVLFVQLLVGLFTIPPSVVKAYGNGFTYSRSITIDHTKVPNTDQSNFPVLVSGTYTYLKTTGNGGLVTNASGYDVGFYTNSDCGTGKMAWETETYTATTGVVNYWVKVPTVATASDTVFYMCYGNSSITTDQSAATSVWDTNYKAVWHLKESGNGTANEYIDSTSNGNHGQGGGGTASMVPTLTSSGQIDGAQTFDGAAGDDDRIQTNLAPSGYSAITMSAWVNLSSVDSYPMVLSYGTNDENNPELRFFSNSGKIEIVQRANNAGIQDTANLAGTSWHYVVGVSTGTTLTLYKDGTLVGTGSHTTNIDSTTSFRIGRRSDDSGGSFTIPGSIDEARVSNAVRAADWIATEYNNQNSPSTFYTVGSESSDTTAPIFSSVTPASSSLINNVTSSSAIAFTTDEALASGSITITRTSGTDDANSPHTCTLTGTSLDVGAHTIDLSDTTNGCTSDVSNLVSGAVYTFVLAGQDAAANVATSITSTSVTFDNTAPTAAITYSDADATVKAGDTLTITATFSEPILDSPIVKLALSGSNTLSALDMTKTSTTVYTYSHTVGAGDGTATVALSIGTDAAGNVVTSAPTSGATFTVDNTAPAVSITAPADLATVSGSTVSVTADATDAVGVVGVQFKLDGTNLEAEDTTSTYEVTWDSTSASEGSHTITAVARDAAGNSTTSGTITVTVDNIVIPSVTTGVASSVATSTLTLNGSITVTGGADATQSGFAYGTDATLTTVIATSTLGAQTGTASLTENLTGLTPNTTYYFRAYATNSAGTGYGSILSTTTVAITIPTVTTSSASGVTDTIATLNGSIDTLGGENATARGFEWGHTIVYDATTTESGSHSTGTFTASLSSLTCATEYHFRGYAINSAGTGYGSDQTFTTSACPVVTPPSSGGGGGGGGFSPPLPRTPEGGYVFFITPNPTTNGFVTLHFLGGQDITRIQISDNPSFSPATYFDYVTSTIWTFQSAGEKTLYARFCNQYARCGETVIAKVMYAPPPPPQKNTEPSFIENIIPDFIKKTPPEPKLEQPAIKQEVTKAPPQSLEGDWELLSNSLVYNFVLAPLPSDIAKLTDKFPELGKVFARLGITKISDLEKLKNTNINLPVIADKKNVPSEILAAEGGQGLITLGSSLVLTSGGEVRQKIETIAGKPIILSVKPEGEASSIKGYLLFKRKPEKTAMEIPTNSLMASALLALTPVAQISSETPTIEQELLVHSFEYTDPDGDGIFTAEISAPVVDGEYEVLTVINYKDKEKGSKELRMITVVDPEGYVYEKNSQGKKVILDNVKVTIFSISNGAVALWDASTYNQDNPQITDTAGRYSFLVPPGRYYITVEGSGYNSYKGDEFEVKEGSGVHFNIEMTKNGSWLRALVDWKMFIIIIFGIAILVNFINDRRLRKQLSIK